MPARIDSRAEWLEVDGAGGFASGTASGVRTRRYHALLLAATRPPTGRVVLVNGVEAWLDRGAGPEALTSHRYLPDVTHPDGASRLAGFEHEPWPRWTWRLADGSEIEHEVLVARGGPFVALSWSLRAGRGAGAARGAAPAAKRCVLRVRPLLSGRDVHALHRENPGFRFDADAREGRVSFRPYDGLPEIVVRSNGAYRHAPDWYRNFLYEVERERGLDHVEDLASPGEFEFDLARGEAVMILSAGTPDAPLAAAPEAALRDIRAAERRRRKRLGGDLERAADAYIVRRGAGKTIVAGYPWFTDWGRDSFIALRGLCLATGRLDDARAILVEWAGAVSQGMLPNRFVEEGEAPEFNAVDASLWYVIAAHEYLAAVAARGRGVPPRVRRALEEAVEAILSGYAAGTRYRIHLDSDGLLAAGEPGVQLTWMDAKVGDWVVTPRIGKPVEVQALWLNALRLAGARSERWARAYERGVASFQARFWDDAAGHLYDVVDVDHVPGAVDASFRPNQILAVGGLPFHVINGGRARRMVEQVERRLWTPLGLRSLAPGEPGYAPRYAGGVRERDGAYHQGTVWPWLIGPFVEAWLRVRHHAPEARIEARGRFLHPLLRHLDQAGLGHVSEVADAERPHVPGGCPFQAWSVAEALRLARLLAAPPAGGGARGAPPPTPLSSPPPRRLRCAAPRARARAAVSPAMDVPSMAGERAGASARAAAPRSWADAVRRHWPEYLIEGGGLGLFMLSACAFGTLLEFPGSPLHARLPDPMIRRVLMGLAMGLTAVSLIYSRWGMRSGAHFNPAVTLTFWRLGRVAGADAANYALAQFAGAAAGVAIMAVAIGAPLAAPPVRYVVTAPGPVGVAAAFTAEAAISALLMSVVLVVSNTPRIARFTGVCAGTLVALFIAFEAPISGMSMNPARSAGSALAAMHAPAQWIYFTAPPLGMLLAAGIYTRARGRRAVFCAKLHHDNGERCIFCEWRGEAPAGGNRGGA